MLRQQKSLVNWECIDKTIVVAGFRPPKNFERQEARDVRKAAKSMRTDDFDYDLPDELIVRHRQSRDSCRLLVLH